LGPGFLEKVYERALMRELADAVGPDGYGEHDDLVIALALVCWQASTYLHKSAYFSLGPVG
jgi:hypothetical protein